MSSLAVALSATTFFGLAVARFLRGSLDARATGFSVAGDGLGATAAGALTVGATASIRSVLTATLTTGFGFFLGSLLALTSFFGAGASTVSFLVAAGFFAALGLALAAGFFVAFGSADAVFA